MSDMAKSPGGQIIVYRTEDGRGVLRVRLENETVWLPQAQMAELSKSPGKPSANTCKPL